MTYLHHGVSTGYLLHVATGHGVTLFWPGFALISTLQRIIKCQMQGGVMPVQYSIPVKAASLLGDLTSGMNRKTLVALQKLRPEPQEQLQSRRDVQ